MAITWQQLIEKVKSEIEEMPPEQLHSMMLSENNPVIIDVREQDEFTKGHLPAAIFIPRGFLELRIEATVPSRDQIICLYCGGGNRSALAARSLNEMGYTNVYSLEGGYFRWLREERPVHSPKEPEEAE
jgi:adenylyltransferase/sulfurtransferase